MRQFFTQGLKVDSKKDIQMVACHRIGQRRTTSKSGGGAQNTKGRPRTIIVRFLRMADRDSVWMKRRALKDNKDYSRTYINEDFAKETDKVRKALLPSLKAARKDNKKCFLKGETLIIDGQTFTIGSIPLKYRT